MNINLSPADIGRLDKSDRVCPLCKKIMTKYFFKNKPDSINGFDYHCFYGCGKKYDVFYNSSPQNTVIETIFRIKDEALSNGKVTYEDIEGFEELDTLKPWPK